MTDRLHHLMIELEAKAETLEVALAAPAPPPVALPDNLAALYRERIANSDVCLIVPMDELLGKYAKHFLHRAG